MKKGRGTAADQIRQHAQVLAPVPDLDRSLSKRAGVHETDLIEQDSGDTLAESKDLSLRRNL